jgi:diguanylate cyclase (GGDEF)-like protein
MDVGVDWMRKLFRLQAFVGILIAVTAFWQVHSLTLLITLLAAFMEIISVTAVGIVKFRQGYRLILLFVLSRASFVVGILSLWLYILFAWPTLAMEHFFMVAFLLEPTFLAFMMIPGTRRRFENYFSLEAKNTQYEELGHRDDATGLYNKAHLLSLLDENIRGAQLNAKPLAFIMIDIDHFQHFNNTWGYPEGDKLIFLLAKLIRQSLRESDIAARYGSGEFAVILPGGTLPSAVLVAERIRQTFEKQTHGLDKNKASTLSLGLSFLKPDDTVAQLIQRADEALYRAKNIGCNRTEFETAP